MKKQYSIKDDFTTLALLLIPIAVAVNIVGGNIAQTLKLPLYLDTIGVIVGAMLCGPWVGAAIGVLTNIILGIMNPVLFAFVIVNLLTGLVTGYLARKNMFATKGKWLTSAFIITAVGVISAAPIVVIVFGGATGSGASIITGTLLASGQNIWASVLSGDGLSAVADRIIAMSVTAGVIKVIPDRTLIKFGCGENYIKNK